MSRLNEVEDLVVRFRGDEGVVHAVNGASFAVGEGETLAIVGESGSGKSVSLLSILNLIPQPPGEILKGAARFDGRDLLRLSADEMQKVRGNEIAMVFQDAMTFLNPVLTIERQMTEAMEFHWNLSRAASRRRAMELLEQVGIPDPDRRIYSYPHQLSGGMRQRCMIAMALACEPRVLVADEPTTALDVTIQAQIIDLMQRIRQETGMAVIWVTHDLAVVAGLADYVSVMYAGRVVEEGTSRELFNNPRHPYTAGLLNSTPRLDLERSERLVAIPGAPPDMQSVIEGCAFYDRCGLRTDRCATDTPRLEAVSASHRSACWESHRVAECLGHS